MNKYLYHMRAARETKKLIHEAVELLKHHNYEEMHSHAAVFVLRVAHNRAILDKMPCINEEEEERAQDVCLSVKKAPLPVKMDLKIK